MTTLERELLALSKEQKIGIMERLWADLSSDEGSFDPPSWHLLALDETERELAAGKVQFEDWADVRRRLRDA